MLNNKPVVRLFVIILAVSILTGFSYAQKWKLTGDEPHYLIITYSIIHNGDMDVKNNYDREDYVSFCHYKGLSPHYSDNNLKGHWYSSHNIGLPLLLVPFFAAGEAFHAEREFCMLCMILLLTCAFCNIYSFCRAFVTDEKALFVGVLASAVTLPLSGFFFRSTLRPLFSFSFRLSWSST